MAMQLLSEIFPPNAETKDLPQWAVEQYAPLDDTSRITRLLPVLDHKTGTYSICLDSRSFYGGIDTSPDPAYNPWLASFNQKGIVGEIQELQYLPLEITIAKLLEDKPDELEQIKTQILKRKALVSNVTPEILGNALKFVAQLTFRSTVSANYAPDFAMRQAVMGRLIGTSSILNGLWKDNWRQHYGHAHELMNFVDRLDARKESLTRKGGVEDLVRRNLRVISPLFT